jgi:tRNA(Ile2) C34 agmatinyltransferase TiaS
MITIAEIHPGPRKVRCPRCHSHMGRTTGRQYRCPECPYSELVKDLLDAEEIESMRARAVLARKEGGEG